MKKVMIPIDGTKRSAMAADAAMELYTPEQAEILLAAIKEEKPLMKIKSDAEEKDEIFGEIIKMLSGYKVNTIIEYGSTGTSLLSIMDRENVDAVVMVRSTKKDSLKTIGSVTSFVVKYAKCMVTVVPETGYAECVEAKSKVNLSGQLGKGQDSCTLPSPAGPCKYRIRVLEGRVRVSHMIFTPDGRKWQKKYDAANKGFHTLSEGQTMEIDFFIGRNFGHEDKVIITNTSLFDHAIVEYEFLG